MPPKRQINKAFRKQKRCEIIIQNDLHIKPASSPPTVYLGILNAGLSNGLTEESVLVTVQKYGKICKLLMLPTKSYCFMECQSIEDAINIYDGMHGKAEIGQNNTLLYLSYFESLPNKVTNDVQHVFNGTYPPGLYILKDFVTIEEELQLLNAVNIDSDEVINYNGNADNVGQLKHRKVKHFGYEFFYNTNNVDIMKPLENNSIPEECNLLWMKLELKKVHSEIREKWDWQVPDQLTVNLYEPGQGIPFHVDTHSAFLQPILSLSLKSDIIMDFRRGKEKLSVYLPQRSLMILSDEARYDWMHAITPRIYDVIMTSSGNLSVRRRQQRVSLTFRKLRKSKECDCKYYNLCDTKKAIGRQTYERRELVPLTLEQSNVHQVYDNIAEHFSGTRHTPWPKVKEFLLSLPEGSVVLDVGCGNGKYLNCNRTIFNIGCDRCANLLKICKENSKTMNSNDCFRCDCLNIPLRTACIDGCLSIAVIHHLSTHERRLRAFKEIVRVLKPGGRGLVYVWAKNQNVNNQKTKYLKSSKNVIDINKEEHGIFEQQQHFQHLPIHTNRTEFQHQDILVPWKTKMKMETNTNQMNNVTFLRYYHVFAENEMNDLLKEIPNIQVINNYYDQGNYCCIFEKISINSY